ncbi:MAG: amidohydrolase family protein, partial [Enterobacterales bacterium]|nr:amidohydrolase family protein [Enterobacterales bacterium]
VIQAATISAADALGLESEIGQIKAGLNADFVLVEQNPLMDVAAFESPLVVTKDGVWLNREELLELRAKAIENRSVFSEIVTLISNY